MIIGGGAGSGVGFDRMFNGSVGMQVNRMLDALGLPDSIGDLVGARIDAQRGDLKGMMRNLQDLTSGMSTGQTDALFGRGLPRGGFVPRPMDALKMAMNPLALPGAIGSALAGGLAGGLGGIMRGFNPFGGISREAPMGTGFVGRSMERAIRADPFFRSQMESALGGKILMDGRNDGKLTVWRPPFNQVGSIMKQALGAAMLPPLGIAGALAGMSVPLGGAMLANRVAGSILGGLQRMEANVANFAAGMTDGIHSREALSQDPQAKTMANAMGIDVRNASFEDIIALLLMKYAKNKENDVMKKVSELDKSMQAGDKKDQQGGGCGGGLGGLLGGVGGLVGNAIAPGVGGAIGGAAGNLLGGLLGGGGAQGAQGAGGAGGGLEGTEMGGQMDPSKMSDTMKQQALQKLMSDLQKTYEMLTNMMKSMHDMQMSPIRNLRG